MKSIFHHFQRVFNQANNTDVFWRWDLTFLQLRSGGLLFKSLGISQPLEVHELSHLVDIEGFNNSTDVLLQHSEIFRYNSKIFEHSKDLNSIQIGNGAKFNCGGLSFSVLWNINEVSIFDSHSWNGQCFPDPKGHAVL